MADALAPGLYFVVLSDDVCRCGELCLLAEAVKQVVGRGRGCVGQTPEEPPHNCGKDRLRSAESRKQYSLLSSLLPSPSFSPLSKLDAPSVFFFHRKLQLLEIQLLAVTLHSDFSQQAFPLLGSLSL
jgi:hypothetical protein